MKKIELGEISLNVKDLNRQKEFYQNTIGLYTIEENEIKVDLGIQGVNEILVSLVKVENEIPQEKMTGLYHLALLLPTRKALGGILRHLIEIKAPLIGASDHGYSEALYLQDPEGNGIEIYRDKEKSQWDVKNDGQIKGVTLEMDAEGVLAEGYETLARMPEGTKMGHVHLSVADFEANERFYRDLLGFNLTDDLGGHARFFAMDGYHHHIGTNNWLGSNLKKNHEGILGINYYKIYWEKTTDFEDLKKRIVTSGYDILNESSDSFDVIDPNGILIKMIHK
ncbi:MULTISPECIES: VOC family protein [Vagococcus]|uniref:Glyoxalase family protein n=1 Tax=Vagococcus fluvialis bH819 TaxID=1255619 RepID=A0A1X6WMP6_9ENTE|nr:MULTISPECIES: VOC family protein [Vagococcus]SLM84946.1 Glyoxalase family protein [Vagococcus fluvialis bH819]HCM90485.1 VOC family protein [Vagococcus sp.]